MPPRKHTTNQPKPLPFEEAYAQLEQTVKALEAGGIPLDDATRLFEEGMRLARICQEHLAATELKVTRLQRSYGEQMGFVPEAPEEGEPPEPEDEEPSA